MADLIIIIKRWHLVEDKKKFLYSLNALKIKKFQNQKFLNQKFLNQKFMKNV